MSKAIYTYKDGEEYRGQWNDEGKKEGLGILTTPIGIKYTGCFENGMFSNSGVLVFPDGSRYEGQFTDGKFDGFGVFTGAEGMLFEGEFREGRVSGKGLITFPDGQHGLPRREGIFEGTQLRERVGCPDIIERARKEATLASSMKVEF